MFMYNILTLAVLFAVRGQCHFHESLLPKSWGDLEQLQTTGNVTANQTDNTLATQYRNQLSSVPPPNSFQNRLPSSPELEPNANSLPQTNGTTSDSPEWLLPRVDTPTEPNSAKSTVQFVWRVYNFSDILCSGQELIFSPRFYLNEPGYRLQLLLVTNTTYSDMVSYLGLFFRVVAGDYDASLEWPFKYRTVLSVVEHGQLANWTSQALSGKKITDTRTRWNHTVIPNIDECRLRSAFLRPNSDIETGANTDGCGNRRHIPLSELESDRYMQDDTLLILATVHLHNDPDIEQSFRKAQMSMRYNELVSNYHWTIEQFSQKENDSVHNGRIAILTSNPFYTHPNGYLLQLFLTILPKRNAFAVSIAFVQGDHDRYLQWPFPYAFEMAIEDQSPDYWKRDITVKVKPSKSDCGTEAFGQPGQTPEFCFLTIQSLQVLSLTHYNFLINDTLKIRFTTRFERYSSRQRSSILFRNNRLVSEFNWLIPGIVGRFDRYINENRQSNDSNTSSTGKKSHRFVSDEFYTNGQGYLCQLVLTVSVRSIPTNRYTPVINKTVDQTENPIRVTTSETNSNVSDNRGQNNPRPPTMDVLVFGLELVIIEGEYDRFLEWPFNNAYELSIVGYKSMNPTRPEEINEQETNYSDNGNNHFYTVEQNKPEKRNENRTNSQLIIPSNKVNKGQCSKEAFQKPIERNPPCGIKEFFQFSLTPSGDSKRQSKNIFSPTSSQPSLSQMATSTQAYELGTIGKSEEDLHLRVRIYL